MSKVKLEHELLDSKIATAAALYNEWVKWCLANGIKNYQIPHITGAFVRQSVDFNPGASSNLADGWGELGK